MAKAYGGRERTVTTNRILVIVTNAGEYEKVGYRTGLWLGELTHFYDYVRQHGFDVDIASPAGGFVPIDPESLSHEYLSEFGTNKRYHNKEFMDLLEDTKRVADVDIDDYDAIYMTGGHGVMFDFRQSEELEKLVAEFYDSGRVVSAVCHGPAGLLNVQLSSGEPVVKGKRVTGFSWLEEEAAGRTDAVPYILQDELKKLGADYSTAGKPFATYVVEDGQLITGQNPGSARAVAEAVVNRLEGALA
jgi:putative intracellular protease/amidase